MTQKIKKIGLLIHDSHSEYSMELIKGLENECAKCGAQLVIFTVGEFNCFWSKNEYQCRAVAFFISSNNIDALICASGTQLNNISMEEFTDYLNSFKPLPVVSVGVELPNIPSVVADCARGLKNLINHLIDEHNCKRFGVVGVSLKSKDAEDRMKVIAETLKERSLSINESDIIYGKFTYSSVQPEIVKYVEEHGAFDFDAVLSLNDDMAFALIDYCREHGINLPENMKICGFDDIARASLVNPSLSSVNQRIAEQGSVGVKTALKLIDGNEVPLLQYVETQALYRQSCGCVEKDSMINAITDSGETIAYAETHATTAAIDWHRKKSQLYDITDFQMSRIEYASYSLLKESLIDDLKKIDCHALAVCLYEPPKETDEFVYFDMPEKVQLFAAFDDVTGFDSRKLKKTIYFNPHEHILPPDVMADTQETTTVFAIYQQNIQYGYVVWRTGSFDVFMYNIVARTLSCLFGSAFMNDKATAHRQHLEESNMRLMKFSRTDELTQILNRRGFMGIGQQTIDIAMDMRQTGMIIYGDMDGLKKINDTYGHEAGDRAIKAEAEILKKVFRASDIIGRLGGDEFGIIAVGLNCETFIKVKKRAEKFCSDWNAKSDENFILSISLGAAPFDEENSDLEELLKKADAEQYEEKRRKKVQRT